MKYLYILFLCFGFIFIAAGLGKIGSYVWFFSRAVVVPGKIVRYEQREEIDRESERERTMYAAVVSYTFEGQIREATASISSSSPSQGDIGTVLKVGINPKNHNDVRVDSIEQVFLLSIGCILGGCVWLLLAFCFSSYFHEILALLFSNGQVTKPTRFVVEHPQITHMVISVGVPLAKHARVLLLGMVTLAFGGGGAWLLYSHVTFFKQAIMVPGKVVRYSHYWNSDSHTTMYSEVVSYSFNGETREITSSFSSSEHDEANIGKIRQVGINPHNPYEARIYSKGDFVIAMVLLSIGGLLALCILRTFL